MTKLILVEGVPGSGKSTIAENIAQRFRSRGRFVDLYPEGPGHPVDLGWNACFPIPQYNEFLKTNSRFRSEIESIAVINGEYVIVPVSEILTSDESLFKQWLAFECYTGHARISNDVCLRLLCNRWKKFGEQMMNATTLSIFDAAFFQSQMLRLLLWSNSDEQIIISQLKQLAETVTCLSPVLLYLTQPDGGETIIRAAKERQHHRTGVSFYGNWLDSVIADSESSPFWKHNHLSGMEGVLEYFAIRKQMELTTIAQLPITCKIIETADYNWVDAWAKIDVFLNEMDS